MSLNRFIDGFRDAIFFTLLSFFISFIEGRGKFRLQLCAAIFSRRVFDKGDVRRRRVPPSPAIIDDGDFNLIIPFVSLRNLFQHLRGSYMGIKENLQRQGSPHSSRPRENPADKGVNGIAVDKNNTYHAAGSYGPGRLPVDDPASAALKKGTAGDRAMTERFCAEILEERAPALAIMWLSEPDYTGHHSPLGSPEHRSAIAGADRCARQVFETVRRLDPSGDRILFITGSDHGMETITRAIDLDALLIGAGLKRGPQSRDVVVAPNGTAATLYFADPDGDLVPLVARFLAAEDWVGEVFAGDRLAAVGLPTNSAMRIAVTLAGEDCANPHGVRGYCPIVQDPADSESKVGFGQHGGLGPNEQRPFLMIEGGGFAPGPRHEPTSLIDIAPTVLRHLHMAHDDMDGRALPRVGG